MHFTRTINILLLSIYLISPMNSFAFTGDDFNKKIQTIGEKAANFVRGVTSFDAAKILAKRDAVVQIIRERRKTNKEILDSNSPLATERELEEMQRHCSNVNISERLEDSITNNCRFNDIKEQCETNNSFSSEILQKTNSEINNITGNNIIGRLKTFYSQIVKAKNKVYALNVSCLKAYNETITNPACLNAYETVFNDSMNNYLKFNCTEKDVENGIYTFIQIMRDPERGVGQYITVIQDAYAKSRTTEAGIAAMEANILDTIIEWEANNKRTPTSSNPTETR